jgi:hypothetical protein
MKSLHFSACLLLCAGGVLTSPEPAAAGTQTMIARYTPRPVVLDGVLGPAEWSAAIPVHVKANKPGGPPGVVPGFIAPPDNQDDSSFTIYAMYDRSNLYVAVDVADNILWSNGPAVWLDDDVEVFIDGDRKPGDLEAGLFSGQPNNEGFQLLTSVGNNRLTEPENFPSIVWDSRAGVRPRGYVVEVRIPFSSINTHDTSPETGGTPGFRPLQPGDTIGFNVTVGDDDCGCSTFDNSYPYPNGYIAWDGSSPNWFFADETAWGTLYLAP